MSLPIKTGLPDDLELPALYTIRWRASDPVTGADVANVVVSQTSLYGVAIGVGPIGTAEYKPVLLRTQVSGGAAA